MTNLEKIHFVVRVEQTVLQLARLDKATGDYPLWTVQVIEQLQSAEREYRALARKEAA